MTSANWNPVKSDFRCRQKRTSRVINLFVLPSSYVIIDQLLCSYSLYAMANVSGKIVVWMDFQQDVNETFFRYLLSLTFRVRCLEANGKSFSKVRQIVGMCGMLKMPSVCWLLLSFSNYYKWKLQEKTWVLFYWFFILISLYNKKEYVNVKIERAAIGYF